MRIKNVKTGDIFDLDRKLTRVRRVQRRVHAWATALNPFMQQRGVKYRLVMTRLSYRPGEEYHPNDIREFMLRVRSELGQALKAYAWVAELQERGAVHYHLLLLVHKGTRIPFFDDAGWWLHGSTNMQTAVKTVFYICSYTSKEGYQKFGDFPRGLRMFAVWISKDVELSPAARWDFRLSALPAWLSSSPVIRSHFFKIARRSGGGWLVDGFEFFSPFKLCLS